MLHAGDALFIPEGWFHQVDSDDLTIAVNFWWKSNLMSGMSEHMDAYYLRIILRRLSDKHTNQVLRKSTAGAAKLERHAIEQLDNGQADGIHHSFDKDCRSKDSKGNKLKEKLMLHELEPLTLKALNYLVLWSMIVLLTIMVDSTSTNSSADKEKHEHADFVKMTLFDDPVAYILWSLHPLSLQNVFLAMAHNFPRTLEALILHLLSPVGAEVLT
ncbi:lysine-specific demethylase JMJ31-like isoform X2 [Actinidia eriantha]|uniref:lysine-specific demethylase JMJ31-like isoform X2 n=1 Tax=Actinidia eriantha TaxID=165200 RepID=UPI002590D4CE|nr:lysine-specific demethylase JMJ31-like isoform X2 [Actinidia eriantha]